jgi:hypothetical protein
MQTLEMAGVANVRSRRSGASAPEQLNEAVEKCY